MPQYFARPLAVPAVQWFKDGDHPLVVKAWSTPEGIEFDRSTGEAFGKCASTFYALQTGNGIQQVLEGDWIVTQVDGVSVIRKEHFKARFGEQWEIQPKVYADMFDGRIELSAYSCDHPDDNEREAYTIELIEYRNRHSTDSIAIGIGMNVLRNVLARAGVCLIDQ